MLSEKQNLRLKQTINSTSKTTENQLDDKSYTKLGVHQTYITKLILISTYCILVIAPQLKMHINPNLGGLFRGSF